MAKKLSELPKDIDLLSKTLIVNSNKRARIVAIDLHSGLTRVNPKRTGRSAGSWHIGVEAPVWGVVEPPEGSEKNPNAFVQERVLAEQAKLAEIPPNSDGIVIYITNNTEYLGPLNAGSSKQADPFWIEGEIDRVRSTGHGVRLLEGKVK